MPAYVVAMMSIHDPLTYREYTDRTPSTVKMYGGKFLTRGEPVTTVEGEKYKDRMVILQVPSMAQVQAWFADPAYQEAMAFRHAASTMLLLVVQEGGANTEDPNPNRCMSQSLRDSLLITCSRIPEFGEFTMAIGSSTNSKAFKADQFSPHIGGKYSSPISPSPSSERTRHSRLAARRSHRRGS